MDAEIPLPSNGHRNSEFVKWTSKFRFRQMETEIPNPSNGHRNSIRQMETNISCPSNGRSNCNLELVKRTSNICFFCALRAVPPRSFVKCARKLRARNLCAHLTVRLCIVLVMFLLIKPMKHHLFVLETL